MVCNRDESSHDGGSLARSFSPKVGACSYSAPPVAALRVDHHETRVSISNDQSEWVARTVSGSLGCILHYRLLN